MSEHKVNLRWERGAAEFVYQKYPRDHTWSFDGGHTMTASAAPAYLGNPANVDPEEAFVASLSSCHMLTFLAIACKQKFILDKHGENGSSHPSLPFVMAQDTGHWSDWRSAIRPTQARGPATARIAPDCQPPC